MTYTEIIGKLTLEEKCALLSGATQFGSRANPRLGIPAILFSDGPNGVRKQAGDADHLGLNPSEPATCFPTSSLVACSWDEELTEELGQALGAEAAAHGVGVLLGPGLNIKRNPLCGRNFEYYSEDPYLSGKLAAAYIRGVEHTGISACPKHFAVNSQEKRRMVSDSIVDERTLRELYLTGFEIAVKEGGPGFLMSAYNLINGVYANENEYLLQQVLRREWGFDGAVVTDWGGSNDHVLGVQAGSNVQMPAPGGDAVRQLLAAVRENRLTEGEIDARLEELLPQLFRCAAAVKKAPKEIGENEAHALARRVAEQSMVLLKNEDSILPLRRESTVAVIGDFAAAPRYQGAGSSAVNALRVEDFLSCAEGSLNVAGFAPGFRRTGETDEALKAQAAELAGQAEVALVFLGLDEIKESEGRDREDMKLAQNQIELLEAVAQANPNVVVVLICGAPVETGWLPCCKGLLYAGLGGQAGAAAIVDLLTGARNPCGKLAETWPVRYEDVPSAEDFPAPGRTAEYREGLYVGYRYFETTGRPVAFPFGFGLSYTEFSYSDLRLENGTASVTVRNTGATAGSEIVQLYVDKPVSSVVFGPKRELKGFRKVELAPGEAKTVVIPLEDKAFRFWDTQHGAWAVEGGTYTIRIGASVQDIRLSGTLEVPGSGRIAQPPAPYVTGEVRHVSDEDFAALLGHPVPGKGKKPAIDRNLTLGELNRTRSPIAWLAWLVLTALLKRSIKQGKPNLNLLFNYNMPLRAIAGMTGGMVSMGMVDALVMELKGFWVLGILRCIYEAVKNQIQNRGLEQRLNGQ